jgi:hypothetical protein
MTFDVAQTKWGLRSSADARSSAGPGNFRTDEEGKSVALEAAKPNQASRRER